jgi:hypothetical protein
MSVMDPFTYKLDAEHRVVPAKNDDAWFDWCSDIANRRVALTEISADLEVVTSFLGLDLSFGQQDPPVVFETLVCGGKYDGFNLRASSWDEAQLAHQAVLNVLQRLA